MTYTKTLGTLHRETGISVPTLKLYSDLGLIPSIRSSIGHRLFPANAGQLALQVRAVRMGKGAA
jgi:DNA-binding transcriptional MerR regulator